MAPEDKAALAEAVNTLINDIEAEQLLKQLTGVHDLAKRGVPVRLVGRPSVLNPILDLWIKDEDAAERIFQLVNRKRAELELTPIGDYDIARRSYMRELMAQKRERGRRLVALTNRLRADTDQLKGTTRMEYERAHANRWYEVKKERELAARERFGRRLTAKELADVSTQLWQEVDAELDAYEDFVRVEERKPILQRAPHGFKFRLQPKKGST